MKINQLRFPTNGINKLRYAVNSIPLEETTQLEAIVDITHDVPRGSADGEDLLDAKLELI